MGGGGLLQLVAYGAQDVYLTGNPQITFWKVVYRRYTNFSLESIEQTFNGFANFGKRVTCTISRNGDLIWRTYLQVDLPALTGSAEWVSNIGLALIKNVTVEIGGQQIDKHYGEWLYIWNELSQTAGKKDGYKIMTGAAVDSTKPATLFVPLEFWFNTNPGLALPLIALQYHEVKINIEFRSVGDCYIGTPTSTPDFAAASLWVDYIFLDTDERRRFAQLSHEYLITQLQFTGEESFAGSNQKFKLSMNHPVRELIWTVQRDDLVDSKSWFEFGLSNASALTSAAAYDDNINPIKDALLQLNGHDRFTSRPGEYFSLVQPYQHHENVPTVGGINVYSFALKPEEHQPSGTLNMSRIDTAVLNLSMKATFFSGTNKTAKLRVFGVNYNVLRILSGMGGLAYS